MPDIIQMDYSYLTQYADSGQLAALDKYIENGLINTSDVADSVIDSGTINGKCYAREPLKAAPVPHQTAH